MKENMEQSDQQNQNEEQIYTGIEKIDYRSMAENITKNLRECRTKEMVITSQFWRKGLNKRLYIKVHISQPGQFRTFDVGYVDLVAMQIYGVVIKDPDGKVAAEWAKDKTRSIIKNQKRIFVNETTNF